MARTFKEKVDYNSKKAHDKKTISWFASGYDYAVFLYQSYIKGPESLKKLAVKTFDDARVELKKGKEELKSASDDMAKYNAQSKIDYSKGILSGLRDAANDRKKRQNPPS